MVSLKTQVFSNCLVKTIFVFLPLYLLSFNIVDAKEPSLTSVYLTPPKIDIPPNYTNITSNKTNFNKVDLIKSKFPDSNNIIYVTPRIRAIFDEETKVWYEDIRIILGIVAILLTIFNVLFTIYKFRKENEKSIFDDYWLRQVILPKINDPLNEFYSNGIETIQIYTANSKELVEEDLDNIYIELLDYLQPLKNSFDFLAPFSSQAVLNAHAVIHDFEDDYDTNKKRFIQNPTLLVTELYTRIIGYLMNDIHYNSSKLTNRKKKNSINEK